jgi:hypothetical protein
MSIAKLLAAHERASLYSGANSAIWHAHSLASALSRRTTREEDHVATLIADGIPVLAARWGTLLQKKGIALRVSGVFCHGHPQVTFGRPSSQVELADFLVVHQHTVKRRSSARALLVQAKMSAAATHALPTNDAQLQLFSRWPPFEFVTGGLQPGPRNIGEKGHGSRYALVLSHHAYPEDLDWADQCPWAASPAQQRLTADISLARLLGDILLGKDGRTFQLGKTTNEWSRMIQELLSVTGQRTYRRVNIGRGQSPRLVSAGAAAAGLMFSMQAGSIPLTRGSRASASLLGRYFSDVRTDRGGGEGDTGLDQLEPAEGGISSLLIETAEGQG